MSAGPFDPWSDRAALAEAAADCRATRERLIEKLSARLAELHGVDLGVRYWRIVLGSWPLYHLQQLEDRSREGARRGRLPAGCLPRRRMVSPHWHYNAT